MRAHPVAAGAPRLARPHAPAEHRSRPSRRLDPFEWLALLLFGAISLWVLTLDLIQVIGHGQVWTGTDGVYDVDQLQYLAWIRDASHHILISNLFVLHNTTADYFQPAIVLSGALVALGVAPYVALLLWKPIAILIAFVSVRWFVRASLDDRAARRAALALALFFGAFSIVYGSPGVVGDIFLGFLSWGYTFGLLALGAMVLALLFYVRARSTGRRRSAAAAAALGALAASLHPWQGEILILIVLGGEAWTWLLTRARPPHAGFTALVVLCTGLLLVYYLILGLADPSWHLARIASKHSFPLDSVALALLPLALFALPAYRRRPDSFLDAATRLWPVAALAIFVFGTSGASATPLHAFQGVTVPLAVLATRGAQQLGIRRLPAAGAIATAVVAAVTVPSVIVELNEASKLVKPQRGNANFIARDEQRALRFLAHDPDPGGVLTRFYLGSVVPGATGRHTFVGDCIWSEPRCMPRAGIAQKLFDGRLPRAAARAFVLQSGARFILADCQTRRDMDRLLAPLTTGVWHFGCAAVYEVKTAAVPAGALAESAPDAALRAPGRHQRGVQSV